MLRRLRPKLTYANVVATLALVLAVGTGGAYAAKRIRSDQIAFHAVTGPKVAFNAITPSKVRNGSLSGADIDNNTISSSDIRDGSLRSNDFAAGQLPPGPKGDPGAPAADMHGTVSAGGALSNAAGATAVSAGANATYTVTFAKDVSTCAIVAIVATSGDADGGTVTGAPSGAAQQVIFRTRDKDGALSALPFSFALFC
jgi:hypothetical protein